LLGIWGLIYGASQYNARSWHLLLEIVSVDGWRVCAADGLNGLIDS